MSPDSTKTSSLMFGIQWDLVCKFLEVKSDLTVTDINSNSASWGNYFDSTITLNRGKYAVDVYDEETDTESGWNIPFEWKNYNENENVYNSVINSKKQQVLDNGFLRNNNNNRSIR